MANLITLPSELQLHIAKHITSVEDLVCIKRTCKDLYLLVNAHSPVLLPPLIECERHRLQDRLCYTGLDLLTAFRKHTAWMLAIGGPLNVSEICTSFATRYRKSNPSTTYSAFDLDTLAWMVTYKRYNKHDWRFSLDGMSVAFWLPSLPAKEATSVIQESHWPADMEFAPMNRDDPLWDDASDWLHLLNHWLVDELGLPRLDDLTEGYLFRPSDMFDVAELRRTTKRSHGKRGCLLLRAKILTLVEIVPRIWD
ncbi:hypothetical protein LTR10_010560 [Elasticomyces elasticus]|nr:hypothetical protein LTR10_010560 [Elasticomyces elasticus]KAK4972461.1 hypothetical protein LTR42_006971 [Elasticomyces elasticus]